MINSAFSLAFNGKALLNNSKEMLWNRNIFTVTTATDGHGTMTASPMSGFPGTNVTLSNTPNAGYNFTGYSITGATLTGNQFTLVNSDVTVKANFYKEPVIVNVSGVFGPSAYVRNLFEPFTQSAEIYNHHFNIANSGPTTIGGIITAFGGPLTKSKILEYSSYYSAFTTGTLFCTGRGITKPVHITRVCYQTNSNTYSYNDIKFGSGANGPWHTGNLVGSIVGSSAIRYYNDMDFVTNSKLSISANPLNVFANLDSTVHFTGYIET